MLALPGLIWAAVDASTSHSLKQEKSTYWVKVFVFGVVTYAILALIYRIFHFSFEAFDLDGVAKSPFYQKADEIAWSVPLSLVLSLIWTATKSHLVFSKFLRAVRITDHSGCDDIWEYALGKASPVGNWVQFRDFEYEVIYEGWVKAYSDGPNVRELLLIHVSVYGFDGEKLYDQHALYLSRDAKCINLEFCSEKEDDQAD